MLHVCLGMNMSRMVSRAATTLISYKMLYEAK